MIPYYILFVLLGLCSIFEYRPAFRNNLSVRNIIFLILLVFIGFRTNIGIDVYSYEFMYNEIKDHDFSLQFSNFLSDNFSQIEFGYYIINFVFSRFVSFHLFLFILSFFNLFTLFYFFNKANFKYKYSFITILFAYTLFREFDVLRQSISFHLFLISLLSVNKPKKYIFINLLGSCFHLSALFLVFIYPLLKCTFSKKLLYSGVVIFVLSFLIKFTFVSNIFNFIQPYNSYLIFKSLNSFYQYLNYSRGFSFTVDIPIFLLIIILIKNHNIYVNLSMQNKAFINVLIVLMFSIILFIEIDEIVSRLSYYFLVGIAFAFVIYNQYFNVFSKKLTFSFPILFILLKFSLLMLNPSSKASYTPYSNYIFDKSNYSYNLYINRVSISENFYNSKQQ